MLKSVAERTAFITVRDQDSLDLLAGGWSVESPVRLAADAALNAPALPLAEVELILRAAGWTPSQPKLGININRYLATWASAGRVSMGREAFLNVFAEALAGFHREVPVPMVFVISRHHDAEITQALMQRLPCTVKAAMIDNRRHDYVAVKGVLRHLDLLCGMRLHSLILASSECTPVVGITYQPKVAYYFRELGLLTARCRSTISAPMPCAGICCAAGGTARSCARGWSGGSRNQQAPGAAASAELVAALDWGPEAFVAPVGRNRRGVEARQWRNAASCCRPPCAAASPLLFGVMSCAGAAGNRGYSFLPPRPEHPPWRAMIPATSCSCCITSICARTCCTDGFRGSRNPYEFNQGDDAPATGPERIFCPCQGCTRCRSGWVRRRAGT